MEGPRTDIVSHEPNGYVASRATDVDYVSPHRVDIVGPRVGSLASDDCKRMLSLL
jgi:hypothetical protein